MKLLKKIVALFVFTTIIVWMPAQGFALAASERSYMASRIIKSKINLEKNFSNGKQYRRAIDTLIENKKDDKAYLEMLITKLTNKSEELSVSNEKDTEKVLYVIDYIIAKANLRLAEIWEEILIKKQEEIETPTTSDSEEEIVQQEVLKMQSHMVSMSEDMLNIFTQYASAEETWDFELIFNAQEETMWNFMSNFKFSNYTSKQDYFDSQFSSDIEGNIEYSINSEELKLEFDAFVDFITKDTNIYFLLDDFKSNLDTDDQSIKDYIEYIEEIAQQTKHIKFSGGEYWEVGAEELRALINRWWDLEKYKTLLQTPMFTSYKKEWNKYFLIPTEEFCSEAKKLFGWILGNIGEAWCSQSQYQDMLDEFSADTDIYMTIDSDISTIHIEEKEWDSYIQLGFSDEGIESILWDIVVKSAYTSSNTNFEYTAWEKAYIGIQTPYGNTIFDGTLNSDNSIKSFDMDMNFWEDFTMTMDLLNEKLVGSMKASQGWQEIMQAYISGTMKSDYFDMDMDFSFIDIIRFTWENINGSMNMMVDQKWNQNNLNFWFYIKEENTNIIELEIISEANVRYGNVEILAPTKFIEAEEVFETNENNYDLFY